MSACTLYCYLGTCYPLDAAHLNSAKCKYFRVCFLISCRRRFIYGVNHLLFQLFHIIVAEFFQTPKNAFVEKLGYIYKEGKKRHKPGIV